VHMLVLLIRASCQPAKPSCREDIISWFHEVEMKRSAGVNPSTGKMAKWFHGESTYDIVAFVGDVNKNHFETSRKVRPRNKVMSANGSPGLKLLFFCYSIFLIYTP